MNQNIKKACQYVKNTNGGATRANFIEDHDPIGACLWADINNAGLVRQDKNGRLHLTDQGLRALVEE
jgi:ribosomal protein S19E (S16A)